MGRLLQWVVGVCMFAMLLAGIPAIAASIELHSPEAAGLGLLCLGAFALFQKIASYFYGMGG